MDKIIQATPLDNYEIDIITSSGIHGVFDVKPYIKGEYFEELLDVDFVNANEGFIVDNTGKMYKTTNGGAAWSTINLATTFSKIQFLVT